MQGQETESLRKDEEDQNETITIPNNGGTCTCSLLDLY